NKGRKTVEKILARSVEKEKMTEEDKARALGNISFSTDLAGAASSQLVIEAASEKIEVKKKIFSHIAKTVSADTIIASNTSALKISELAEATTSPDKVVGMHFFNPVHMMPLVEVIRGKNTSDETVATTFQLAKKLGKTPVVVGDGPGFLVNRLLLPYMVEAISLLEKGQTPEDIDKTMESFGMPMGPIELFDEVGIDVANKVAKILAASMGDRMAESDMLDNLVQDNRTGKKSGVGFYKYEGKKRVSDPSIKSYITINKKKQLNDEDLINRMVYPMINEAARCLEEKIAARPQDVDLGMIFGTGFAPFRGGLLTYADDEGISKVYETLQALAESDHNRFKPSSAFEKIYKSG
ncbi:MAG: hypothetical protein KAS58_08310, partial [Calditrichia bacterium]|nr:hypothetical protein [Calditrichia bacterium]